MSNWIVRRLVKVQFKLGSLKLLSLIIIIIKDNSQSLTTNKPTHEKPLPSSTHQLFGSPVHCWFDDIYIIECYRGRTVTMAKETVSLITNFNPAIIVWEIILDKAVYTTIIHNKRSIRSSNECRNTLRKICLVIVWTFQYCWGFWL